MRGVSPSYDWLQESVNIKEHFPGFTSWLVALQKVLIWILIMS
jgi:hypothetical protein